MNYQDAVLIAANKLPMHRLVAMMLSDTAAKLYPYMVYLESVKRTEEQQLISSYRSSLFSYRDNLSSGYDSKQSIKNGLPVLLTVYEQIKVHRAMLMANKEQAWELGMFSLTESDILNCSNFITDYVNNCIVVTTN